jgi:4-hydroxy-3-methylbut-2-enyl diphosphate reductase
MEIALDKIRKGVQSKWSIPTLFAVAVIFWAIGIEQVTVCLFAIFVAFVFLFCDDVKPAFAPILYVSFFIENIYSISVAHWIAYGISIALAFFSIIFFVIRKILQSKKQGIALKKGKLFWPLVLVDIGYLLGGVIGNFHILITLAVLGFCLVSYFLYWISINFCSGLKEYLPYIFVCGTIFISVEMLYKVFTYGNVLDAITERVFYILGTQNINVVGLFLMIGMIATFSLGYKSKNDFLYFLLATFFFIMIFLTYSRTIIFLSAIALVVLAILSFKASTNKERFAITILIFISIVTLYCGIFVQNLFSVVTSFLKKFFGEFTSGRNSLYSWCIDKFLEYPIFGFGFYTTLSVPTLAGKTVILAHNTIIQFLTSTGIFGTLLAGFFYFKKYQLAFKNYNKLNFFLIFTIILIELSGLTDQAATMDNFIYFINMLLLAAIELNPREKVIIPSNCCLCFGSKNAYNIVKQNAQNCSNVVLFKELLHNPRVVCELKNLGVKQKDNIEDLSSQDLVVIRAHGEPKSTYKYLQDNNIKFVDCTCPNVRAISKLAQEKDKKGYKIIIVGKYGKKTGKMHPEVEATASYCYRPFLVEDMEDARNVPKNFDKYFLVVQSTFSYDLAQNIIEYFKENLASDGRVFEFKNTICLAQREINLKSIDVAKKVDYMFVVGGKNSSNSLELFKNVRKYTKAFFVENIDEVKEKLKDIKLRKTTIIGLTGGASTMMEELIEIKTYLENIMK